MKRKFLAIGLLSSITALYAVAGPEVNSLGFRAPWVTNTSDVTNPNRGDIVYDYDDNIFYGRIGSAWVDLTEANNVTTIGSYDDSNDNDTIDTSENVVLADASSAAFTLVLPPATGNNGLIIEIKKTDSTFNEVTLDTDSSELIDGQSETKLVSENESLKIISNNSDWLILNRSIPSNWKSFTPTISFTSGVATKNGYYRREGGSLRIKARIVLNGNTNATTFSLTIPDTSLSIDPLYSGVGAETGYFGGISGSEATQGYYHGVCAYGSSTTVQFVGDGGVGAWTASVPFSNGNNDAYEIDCLVPISGWDN